MTSSTSNSETAAPQRAWRRFGVRVALGATALWLLLWGVQLGYDRGFRRTDPYKSAWVAGLSGERCAAVVLGNSRALTAIDAEALGDALGGDVLNIAMAGTRTIDHLVLLDLFLRDNRTDRVLLEVDHWTLAEPAREDWTDRQRLFTPFLDAGVWTLLTRHMPPIPPREWAFRHMPFANYARFNRYWRPDLLVDVVTGHKTPFFDARGAYLVDRELAPERRDPVPVSANRPPYLDMVRAILARCEAEGIQLVLFTSPWYALEGKTAWTRMADELNRLGVPYFDFAMWAPRRDAFYYDETHLNRRGAEAFTRAIATALAGGTP